MRKLIVLGLVAAILVGVLAIADVVIRHRVESTIASRIETEVPGSHALVHIASFPFVGHLAASGDVPEMTAVVTGVMAGPVDLDTVRVDVSNVVIDRDRLLHGQVELRSIRRATVTATISQASLDAQVGLPVTLGEGTVGIAGLQVDAGLTVSGDRVEIQVPPLPAVSITIPVTQLLPCLGGAHLSPGVLTVTCTTTTLPPAFVGVDGSL